MILVRRPVTWTLQMTLAKVGQELYVLYDNAVWASRMTKEVWIWCICAGEFAHACLGA